MPNKEDVDSQLGLLFNRKLSSLVEKHRYNLTIELNLFLDFWPMMFMANSADKKEFNTVIISLILLPHPREMFA